MSSSSTSESTLSSSSSSIDSSSSSFSTSSQSKSTSSISTSSSTSSSSSSKTSLSTSSTSKSTSSSSSSMDSSSTSSESVGNVSSSSSSSFGGWNKSKPLILGMSAINSTGIINKLAQTISIIGSYYSIGKVFCYFYGPYGFDDSFTVHLDVCLCNDDGEPTSIISSKTLSGSNINGEGWYSFEVDLNGEAPSNKYLSFVIWQDGGNEDDYVLWGYSYSSVTSGTKAIFTNDDTTWQYQEGVIRSLKLIGNFDAYDLEEFKIITPPAEQETITGDLENGEFDGTKYEDGKVVIDNPNFIASFVIDSSGSMGWNDRFDNRIEFINSTIQKIKDNYPNDVIFDIVKFGSQIANTSSIISDIGSPVSININLATPSRKSFSFITSSANASVGAIYENNSYSFTVSNAIVSSDSLVCSSNSSSIPFDTGELTLLSGSGDATISFSSYNNSSLNNRIVAYGFKNFEEDDPCNLADISISGLTYETSLKNWQTLSAGGDTELSIGNNGPRNSQSVDFTSSENLVLRRPISSEELVITKLSNDATAGDADIDVDDSTEFIIGDYIDIVDKGLGSIYHQITNVSSNTITIFPSLYFNIGSWTNNGGIIQKSSLKSAAVLRTITSNILFRDIYRTRNITFFLQTENGLLLEYDISLFKEWSTNNIYFMDETAILPISIFDVNNNPFPDGTKVVFYVGGYPSEEPEEIPSQNIAKNSFIGDNKIYLASTDDYSVGLNIDILNNLNQIQTVEIIEIGVDYIGKYIKIDPVLIYNFSVSDGSKIIKSLTATDASNVSSEISSFNLLSAGLSMVDVTPVYAGRALNPILAKPYDIAPTDPNISYDDLNLNKDLIRNNISDIPSIDGYSAIRILPITEDNLKTINQKSKESTRLLRADYVNNYTDQQIQNSDDSQELTTTTTTTTLSLSKGEDYNIDNPVYLSGGHAQSGMTTFATQLTEENFDGINVYGVDPSISSKKLVKEYEIYPAIVKDNNGGAVLSKQYFPKFTVNFTPPYSIYSDYVGETVSFIVEKQKSDLCPEVFPGYVSRVFDGVYASGSGFKIKYIITNKNEFINSGKLKIRIYSNTVIDIISAASSSDFKTRQDINVVLPKTLEIVDGVENVIQPLTDIDKWRSVVESNPFSQLIESSETKSGSSTSILSSVKEKLRSSGYYIPDSTKSNNSFQYYTNPLEWTMATQYGSIQDTTIDVINGEAILEIPSSEVSALLMIQASIYFGDNNKFEFIRSDLVPVANPIDISPISPSKIKAERSNVTYEIGVFVTWAGESIADNVIVSYQSDDEDENSSQILPLVSKTDNGWAGGVRIGPHNIVKMTCDVTEVCPCIGQYEKIKIFISYLGYTRSVDRIIEWTGLLDEDDGGGEGGNSYYFYINDNSSIAWSDGNSLAEAKIDLNDNNNEEWIEELTKPYDGNNRRRIMGYEQKLSLPNLLTVNESLLGFIQSQSAWIESISYIYFYGLNQNIGHEQQSLSKNSPYIYPWNYAIKGIYTQFRYLNENGKPVRMHGIGVKEYPYDVDNGYGGTYKVITYPSIINKETLSISISLESYDNEYVRDGISYVNIIADVQWEGEYLNGKFIKNKGRLDETIMDYPFPNVTFEAGICKTDNKYIAGKVDDNAIWHCRDTRNSLEGCLEIKNHASVSLSSYAAVVGLYRTNIYNHGGGTHTHACTVDSNGNGITSETIMLSGVSIGDHEHVITNYIANSSGVPSHEHTLRSVAITKLNPTTNSKVNIAINGYVVYDPTNCKPYSYSFGNSSVKPITFSNGNRMMFSTLYINSSVIDKKLIFELYAPNGYTALNSIDTEKGIDIYAKIYFSEYTTQDSEGNWILIPSSPIPDGTRIIWNIDCFKAQNTKESTETFIVKPDVVKKYMYIRLRATAYVEDFNESAEQYIIISSNIMWTPSVYNLLIEPTNDDIYIQDAITKIDEIGASQIHDAIKFSAQRIIQYQTDNPEWKYAKKAIFLLTDGDENTSEYSIDQAINNVNHIDGDCEVPVIPVRLGFTYGSDDIILNKYAKDTCGKAYYMINADSSDINNIIDDIVTGSYIKNNSGVYSNTIDMLGDNLIKTSSLLDILVPLSGRSLFRYRYSSDMYSWSNWSEWMDTSYAKEFDNDIKYKCRYFQYQVKLFGDENYSGPEINSGLKLDYYKAQTFTVFFQPIDLDINYDEYLSSIHITHKANIPSTSSVNYGYTQFNSVNVEDYASVTRPWITPDRHTIILTRYNEKMITKNYKKYTAINGGWANGAIVEVYKVNLNSLNSQLIPSSEYSINNKTGDVTFFNIQNKSDTFIICIYFDPAFRLVCNTFNYGPEAISIDHIGVMYNIGKRIPMVNNGNIIHTPVSERI